MALMWGDSGKDREIALLRRRVSLLEEQVRVLARFTGMDANHLPQEQEVLGAEAQRLAIEGHKIAAIKSHREDSGADLVTATRDVEAFLAQHERV
ncbi:hypothetical protein [Arsenicicoccus sp. oral taxon 190]|uniref:hypothetical protein n=1 Tax=Arsenicicoccus sp. oral taxon 190 TaxID=1658671 RepID=UPI0012E0D03F|nr:hypothetical protein [Arsenicicoccus sp. oral taxon 190]